MIRLLLLLAFLLPLQVSAQKNIRIRVADLESGGGIPYATATERGASSVIATDSGWIDARISGTALIILSAVGYQSKEIRPDTLASGTTVYLARKEEEEETVVVQSFRTESRIENLPTRVEVLGSEEVDEEVGIKPGNIASLIGDIAGVQMQQSSAVSGNVEMRIQGLPGKYTQLLRDGMPLFGAFAGNFSILQLPPLDMKQIEIVKGASSTLYGGGAIAGMVNVVSKRPVEGTLQKTVLLNQSSLGETNANVYLSQRRGNKGFTFFAGANNQEAKDVDEDGYTDLPRTKSLFIHPVLYFYPNAKHTISVGYNGSFENRVGGDLLRVQGNGDPQHAFFVRNRLLRHTADLQWDIRSNNDKRVQFKAIGSWLGRDIDANAFAIPFHATQFSYYGELSRFRHYTRHDLVMGSNLQGQQFHSGQLRLPSETYTTFGIFVQDDWRLHPKLTLETGFRFDVASSAQAFPLPRLSLLYRISTDWTARIGGGYGYRLPSAFTPELDEREYPLLREGSRTAERSHGANADVNFHKRIGAANITLNQSFFITSVNRVSELELVAGGYRLHNWPEKEPLVTRGAETYVQLRLHEFEAYLGYNFTDAQRNYSIQQRQPLIARDKFAAVIAYEFSKSFRAGIEAAHIGRQFREDGSRTPSYLFAAAMMRYDWKNLSFVLNCENLFDYRQSRIESLIEGGTQQNPRFRELWAPIDGRVINLSIRAKW